MASDEVCVLQLYVEEQKFLLVVHLFFPSSI